MRYENSKAFKIFGKRHKDLTDAEKRIYSQICNKQRYELNREYLEQQRRAQGIKSHIKYPELVIGRTGVKYRNLTDEQKREYHREQQRLRRARLKNVQKQ